MPTDLTLPPTSIDLPQCAVCKKPVDRMESDRDMCRATTYYVFFCHGKQQRVQLEEELLEGMTLGSLRIGECFSEEDTAALGAGRNSDCEQMQPPPKALVP